MVEKIFRQSAEFCSEHDVWKLNVAHVFFMQVYMCVYIYMYVCMYRARCMEAGCRPRVLHAGMCVCVCIHVCMYRARCMEAGCYPRALHAGIYVCMYVCFNKAIWYYDPS